MDKGAKDKVKTVMGEFKRKTLHSGKPGPGKGPVVKNRKQAVAIALSEARKAGEDVPAEKEARWVMTDDALMGFYDSYLG